MRKASKILFVLAILSFLIIFVLKMQNNMEAIGYYQGEITEAENRLKVLEEVQGQEEYFKITDEKIAVIDRATEIISITGDFADWCTNNFETQIVNCYYVFEDFVNTNENIVNQIKNIINE
jgi:hypothetical protein